ncbi:MAG: sulfatase-like hydrolase/transferase [Verrucomicrobiota bacterium]
MSSKPNIVLFMSDQHRWDALGCVSPVVKTPHLDRLAKNGIRFEQAVANCPICVPSRYSLMLGLYPHQSGLRFNRQICPSDSNLPLPVLPQRLQSLGYETACFGKTHWYDPGLGVADPSRRGFEHRGVASENRDHIAERGSSFMEDDFQGNLAPSMVEIMAAGSGGETVQGYLGKTSAFTLKEHREGWATHKAIQFLKDRDSSRPFFLNLSLDFPHAPLFVPPGYEDRYHLDEIEIPNSVKNFESLFDHFDFKNGILREHWKTLREEDKKRTVLRYYALCSLVDDCFGRVTTEVERMGETNNTLYIFTSDHGEMLGERNYLFSKYCLYESSIRVPMILSGAGVEQSNTTSQQPAELVDLLPTVLDAAGATPDPLLPGISLLNPCSAKRHGTFAEFHGGGYESEQLGPTYMWRTSEWKLILHWKDKLPRPGIDSKLTGELYHLVKDPLEAHNLFHVSAYSNRKGFMIQQLLEHLALHAARYPRQTTTVNLPENIEMTLPRR